MQDTEKILGINRAGPAEPEAAEEDIYEAVSRPYIFPTMVQAVLCVLIAVTMIVMYYFVPDKFDEAVKYYNSQGSIIEGANHSGVNVIDEEG